MNRWVLALIVLAVLLAVGALGFGCGGYSSPDNPNPAPLPPGVRTTAS